MEGGGEEGAEDLVEGQEVGVNGEEVVNKVASTQIWNPWQETEATEDVTGRMLLLTKEVRGEAGKWGTPEMKDVTKAEMVTGMGKVWTGKGTEATGKGMAGVKTEMGGGDFPTIREGKERGMTQGNQEVAVMV